MLMTEKEAAELLKIPTVTLTRMRKDATSGLPFINLRRHIRYNKDTLLEWAATQNKASPYVRKSDSASESVRIF